MAVPWLHMLEDFAAAPWHLQLEVERVWRCAPLRAAVQGTVVRVFKGSGVDLGAPLTLSLACVGPAGEAGPPSGEGYAQLEDLAAAAVLEVFLADVASVPTRPLYSHASRLGAPSEAPQLDVQAELRAARQSRAELEVERRRAPVAAALRGLGELAPFGLLAAWWAGSSSDVAEGIALARAAWWAWIVAAPLMLLVTALRRGPGRRFGAVSWLLLVCWILSALATLVATPLR